MCKFYSAIVMKNGDLLHHECLQSHEDIIDYFNINDTQGNINKFVRVEYTTENEKDLPDIEKYQLKVDENSTPEWFEKHRDYITEKLKGIVSKRIIISNRKILTGGLYVIKDCFIDKIKESSIVYLQGTVREVWAGGTVQKVLAGGTVQKVLAGGTVQKVWAGGMVIKDNNKKE